MILTKKKITLAFALTLALAGYAQEADPDTIFTRDVDIVRAYIPQIKNSGKINTIPSPDATSTKTPAVNYATWTSPLESSRCELQLLPAATLRKIRQQRALREGYARIGAGNYTAFLGDLYAPVVRKSDLILDILLGHRSAFGKVKLPNDEKTRAKNMTNNLAVGLEKNFVPFTLSVDAAFARNDFNFYGLDNLAEIPVPAEGEEEIENDNNNENEIIDEPEISGERPAHNRDAHNRFDFNVGIVSNERISRLNYDAAAAYKLTKTYTGLAENWISLGGGVCSRQAEREFGGRLTLDNMIYNAPEADGIFWNDGSAAENYAILKLIPFYKFKGETWHVKVGAKFAFAFNKGRKAAVAPDINAKIALVKDVFFLYGNIAGDLKNGNMRNTFSENRYFRPDCVVKNTYIPLDISAGIKTKIYRDLIFNASVGFKMQKDDHLFVNHFRSADIFDNTFAAVIDDVNLFSAGASLSYNLRQKIEILLEGNYLKWHAHEQPYAWHRPNWKIDLGATFHATDDLRLTLNTFMYGKRYAPGADGSAEKLKAVFDLNLEGVYELNSWLAFFAKFNNILAQNYEIWHGYSSQRFNFIAGAILSF